MACNFQRFWTPWWWLRLRGRNILEWLNNNKLIKKLICAFYWFYFDVEYIYGFVWWGVCRQSRWRHSVTEPSQDGGCVLLWQRYDNNKMAAMRIMSLILHLQQYSHRLNLFFFFFIIENAWSKKQKRVFLFSNYQ